MFTHFINKQKKCKQANNLIIQYNNTCNYSQAIELGLKIYNEYKNEQDCYNELSSILSSVGVSFFYLKDIKNSEKYHKICLDYNKKTKNREGIAIAYFNLGACSLNSHKYYEFISYYSFAYHIFRKLNIRKDYQVYIETSQKDVNSLMYLAEHGRVREMGDENVLETTRKALNSFLFRSYSDAIRDLEKVKKVEYIDIVIESIDFLLNNYLYEKSENEFLSTIQPKFQKLYSVIFTTADTKKLLVDNINDLSFQAYENYIYNRFDDAEKSYMELKEYADKHGLNEEKINAEAFLRSIETVRKNRNKIPDFEDLIRIIENSERPNKTILANLYFNSGMHLNHIGRLEKALDLYEQTIDIKGYIATLNNIANIYSSRGFHENAENIYNDSLLFLEGMSFYIFQNNLIKCYYGLGKLNEIQDFKKKATINYQKSIQIIEKSRFRSSSIHDKFVFIEDKIVFKDMLHVVANLDDYQFKSLKVSHSNDLDGLNSFLVNDKNMYLLYWLERFKIRTIIEKINRNREEKTVKDQVIESLNFSPLSILRQK